MFNVNLPLTVSCGTDSAGLSLQSEIIRASCTVELISDLCWHFLQQEKKNGWKVWFSWSWGKNNQWLLTYLTADNGATELSHAPELSVERKQALLGQELGLPWSLLELTEWSTLTLYDPNDFSWRHSPHLTLFLCHVCTALKLKNFTKLHFMYKLSTIIVSDKSSHFNELQQSAHVETAVNPVCKLCILVA